MSTHSTLTLDLDAVRTEEPFSDTGSADDDEILAAILEYTKTRKLKWKNGSKKVRVSRSTKSLVEELLHPDPTKRLGMGSKGAEDIRNHTYFDQFDWTSLRSKTLTIPFEWRPSPKLCGTDLTTEHQDEAPQAALQRMKNEYSALREQYIRMLMLNGDAISSGASYRIDRKRLSDSQSSTNDRLPTSSRRKKVANMENSGALSITKTDGRDGLNQAED